MAMKKVLYIGSPFFGYYKQIIEEFESQGYIVDYYNDRPSENSFIKGLIKLKKSLMRKLIQRYFDKLILETKGKNYNLVFVMNCKVFSPLMIRDLKEAHRSARFVLYMWDSFTLYSSSKELISIFDKTFSFDLDDCKANNGLIFLPLFYNKTYESLGQEFRGSVKYDIASICTAHPNRYKIIKEFFPKFEKGGISIFSYVFLNRFQYYYNKVFIREFRKSSAKEFEFKPLSQESIIKILRVSNTVFDMQHNKQSGLTMRTVETLGAKRKLITFNTSIKEYDFYNLNNVLILYDNDLSAVQNFLKVKYEDINNSIYMKYSLESWIKTILNLDENNYLNQK